MTRMNWHDLGPRAARTLTPRQYQTLAMHVHGMTTTEIAFAQQITTGQVRRTIRTATQRLTNHKETE